MVAELLMADEIRIPIRCDVDIVTARQKGRELARGLGFSSGDQLLIATSISELARNIVSYARDGEIVLQSSEQSGKPGLVVIARDGGPGIPDIRKALEEGYSTTPRSLGIGLPGVRRLMDEFHIVSVMGKGTTVTAKKWNGRGCPSPGWQLS